MAIIYNIFCFLTMILVLTGLSSRASSLRNTLALLCGFYVMVWSIKWHAKSRKASGKIKEDAECKKFRNKGVSSELEEIWNKLFEDTVATGVNCVTPSMNPPSVNEIQDVNVENVYMHVSDNDNTDLEVGDDDLSQYTPYSSRLEDLEGQENSFFGSFVEELSHGGRGLAHNFESMSQQSKQLRKKSSLTTKPMQMKRRKRQSSGNVLFQEHMTKMNAKYDRALEILEADSASSVSQNKGGIASALRVLDRMVDDGSIEMGSDLWCHAATSLKESDTRELFMSLRDDVARSIMDIGRRRRKKHYVFWLTASCMSNILAGYYYTHIYKEPCMTSLQTGELWMKEVLNGHPIRSVNAFRMDSTLFMQLCEELTSKYGLKASSKKSGNGRMSVIEKVGIFIYTLALGLSNRDVSERFQRSGETISRAFHDVLEAITGRSKDFLGLACDIIRPKDPTFANISPHIKDDERYMPFFKNCIGCIDGTHIDASIPEAEQLPYRGRKGYPTFNVMAACDFDMCFTFISAGWEGSAHDTRIFLHAITTPLLNFPQPPQGKYYLVDKGYPERKGYMVPYPKVRYHQSQFENMAPSNAHEAFNRRHSSLRSCIERSFGVLKKRWKILNRMPKYSIQTQIDIILATFALHNYIRKNSEDDLIFTTLEQHPDYIPCEEDGHFYDNGTSDESSNRPSVEMRWIRDEIATLIWSANN
ncbi:hypothetical protein OROMI_003025 [Orobanche minor]